MFNLPSPAQCRPCFQNDGYVLVRDALQATKARALAGTAERITRSAAVSIDRRDQGAALAYSVVTGERIQRDARELFELYTSPDLLAWVRAVTNCATVARSRHLRSAVNINCLTRRGEEYPQHRDAVPYTALLFLSDVAADAGGEFVIDSAAGIRAAVRPRLGNLLLMDGSRCPHAVAPLRRDAWRLTMPMVFPQRVIQRPEGLDEYLYGASGSRLPRADASAS